MQWLSGRVLNLSPRFHAFEPHQSRCVVSLSKTHKPLLSIGSIEEDPSQHNRKIVEKDVKELNQTNKI